MAKFNYRMPNLLEMALLIGLFITIIIGYLIISQKLLLLPVQYTLTAASAITAVFLYILIIWVGVVAIILEYQRQDILELMELLKSEEGQEKLRRIRRSL